eukprot:TRINITY_DN124_c0_g2_i6.p1 TRINITY_DN124_c0_g2~~TRINITY_DN124_c0_g2_i6.p1  ORF type:complete len:198 (+),score=9.70 TRINITY_DN124_c0_g2_i6:118-711(+)
MIRRPPRSTLSSSSAASDVYKRQIKGCSKNWGFFCQMHNNDNYDHNNSFGLHNPLNLKPKPRSYLCTAAILLRDGWRSCWELCRVCSVVDLWLLGDASLNFPGHGHESSLHILIVLRTGLKESDSVLLGKVLTMWCDSTAGLESRSDKGCTTDRQGTAGDMISERCTSADFLSTTRLFDRSHLLPTSSLLTPSHAYL